MIKVIFFSQNSKFRVRNSHFSHRPKQRYARPAPVSGPTNPKRQNRSPSSIFGHSRSLRGFRPPVRPFKNPDFSKTGSYLGNIEHSCVQQISISIRETFPHKREVRPHSCRNASLSRRADGSFRQSIVFRAEKRGAGRVGKTGCNRYLYPAGDTCGAARPAAGPSPAQKHSHDLQKQSPASNRSGRRGNGRQSLLGPVRRGHSQRDGLAVRPCHDRADGRAADRVAGSGPQPDAALRAAIRAADRRGARPAQGNIQPCRVAVRPDRKWLLAQHVRGRAGRLGTRLVVDARRRDTRSG